MKKRLAEKITIPGADKEIRYELEKSEGKQLEKKKRLKKMECKSKGRGNQDI